MHDSWQDLRCATSLVGEGVGQAGSVRRRSSRGAVWLVAGLVGCIQVEGQDREPAEARAIRPDTTWCREVGGLLRQLPGLAVESTRDTTLEAAWLSAGPRPACRVGAAGHWVGQYGPVDSLVAWLRTRGWRENTIYSADGPDGTVYGAHRAGLTCILEGRWDGGDDSDSTYVPSDTLELWGTCAATISADTSRIGPARLPIPASRPSSGRSAPAAPLSYAIVGADVLTMDERGLLERQTVLVRDGRIVALGPVDSVTFDSDEVLEIDGRGRFVMPGLVDAHVHLRESGEEALTRYLRAGVTTVRDMNGRPFLMEWRDRIARGELAGPTLYVASPSIGNLSSPREGYPTPQTLEEGRAAVRRFHEAGYDWIKVYSFLPAEGFAGVMEEAKRRGIPVGGHVPLEVGMDVLASGLRSIEHLTEYTDASLTDSGREEATGDLRTVLHAGQLDLARLDTVVTRTLEQGVWNVPSITWFDRNLPTQRALDAWRRDNLRQQGASNRRLILRRLHDAGARIALGTDSDGLGEHLSPFAVVDELRAMVEAGLTPQEALEAATIRGAELLGGIEAFGTVSVGKRADLLVLYCDPREDLLCLADVEWVVARGRLPVYELDRERQRQAGREP